MSFKTSIVKTAIKLTPNILILTVANIVLKGIAELSDFIFDIDNRSVYIRLTLAGEAEAIEVSLEDFAIVSDEENHHLFLQHAQSNKLWLNNALSRIVGKKWKIPQQPKYQAQIDFIAELFKVTNSEQEDN
ncbi:MAG: hypothetical protein ACKE51_02125 [Methylococcaceae bacterium]